MGKRGRAPKGCYWRGDTLWGRFEVAGREVRRSLRTDDAAIATGRLKALREQETAAAHFGDARVSWKDAVVSWGAAIAGHTKPSTRLRYVVSLTQLEPFLVGLYVDQVDHKLIGEIVRQRRAKMKPISNAARRQRAKPKPISNATIRRDLVALSSVLAHCQEEGWRDDNPALARMKALKERRDPIVLPQPDHVEMVIAKAPGLFADLIRCAWLTGCRQDELRTLERQNLDFARGQIALYKTKRKMRFIDMKDAESVLVKLPTALRSKFVFWHDGGLPYLNISSNFRRLVGSAQKSAQRLHQDFRPFRFHDLRHLFAVEYLKNGGGIYDLSRHMGHSSVKVTEIYLDYLTAEEVEVAKRGSAQRPAQMPRFIEPAEQTSP